MTEENKKKDSSEPNNEEEIKEDVKEEPTEERGDSESTSKETEEPEKETKDSDRKPDETESENSSEHAKESKKFFKKKEKKKDEKDEVIEELKERYTRLMAEFDNFRKRTDKEKESMFSDGIISAIEKILPVIDNFERGLNSIPENDRENPIYTGMEQIYKQLEKTLTEIGIEPMNCEGKEFNPSLHNAVLQAEDENLPENTVYKELQKGYLFHGKVVRHAMVSVVKK